MATDYSATFDPNSEYRTIEGCGGYLIGNDGSIWSQWTCVGGRGNRRRELSHKWKILKTPPKSGYPRVTLIDDSGNKVEHHIHILILTAFVGPRPSPSHQGLHENDIPTDNRLSNLRWGTPADNWEDSRRNGNRTLGEKVHNAKTTAEMVVRIRAALAAGETLKSVASWCGLSWQQVHCIKTRKVWKHVP